MPHRVTSGRSTAQHSTAQHSRAWHGMAPQGTAQHGTAQHITSYHVASHDINSLHHSGTTRAMTRSLMSGDCLYDYIDIHAHATQTREYMEYTDLSHDTMTARRDGTAPGDMRLLRRDMP